MIRLIKTVFPDGRKVRGQGLAIRYGWSESPYGPALTGRTDRGICWIGFAPGGDRVAGEAKMRAHFPQAVFVADKTVRSGLDERGETLDLYGTAFQLRVWEALLKIPVGKTLRYGDIAVRIGVPEASRAVGGAVGANPVSVLIPCHRVLPATGGVGNYGWGPALKREMLEREGAALRKAS